MSRAPTKPLDDGNVARCGADKALYELGRFFMKDDGVYHALRNIAQKLDELGIEYAVAGGMALNAHGHRRGTVDVDLLVTPSGLKRAHEALEGLGYLPPFKGSKNLHNIRNNTRIEFLITGQFPGDGKPKPVAFPDPKDAAVMMEGIRYLGLPQLIELKLASGLTGGAMRMKDFTDVIALIALLKLPMDFAKKLNPYVQPKYNELWEGVHSSPADPNS